MAKFEQVSGVWRLEGLPIKSSKVDSSGKYINYQPKNPTSEGDKIGVIYIQDTDASHWVAIRGFYDYSYIEEKGYGESPTRTATGDIIDLDALTAFLTPRLTIKYRYMNIEDYRALRKIMKKRNVFRIGCYDPVSDDLVFNSMYEAPPPMPISHIRKLQYMGVIDYAIEFIGVNSQQLFTGLE
jgi:hypothetical protein